MAEHFAYREITEKIIGCSMKVHRFFGLGFKEEIYERSLMIELKNAGLNCASQMSRDIFYYDRWVGSSRLDLLIEDVVLLELKAVSKIEEEHCNRILNYLKIFKVEVGLLINFGAQSLQIKRFAYSGQSA